MGMIFYLHTSSDNAMVMSQTMPQKGEILRLTPTKETPDQLVGLFEIEFVMKTYLFPGDHERVDAYARRVGELPSDMRYISVKASFTTPKEPDFKPGKR